MTARRIHQANVGKRLRNYHLKSRKYFLHISWLFDDSLNSLLTEMF